MLERVAPTLFSTDGDARGPAAALIQRVKADGSQTYEYASPEIEFGPVSDRLFLILYGTGFRNSVDPSRAVLRLGEASPAISYLGPQPEAAGLDQLNAELPRWMAGAGKIAVCLQVDGKPANPVTLTFR